MHVGEVPQRHRTGKKKALTDKTIEEPQVNKHFQELLTQKISSRAIHDQQMDLKKNNNSECLKLC